MTRASKLISALIGIVMTVSWITAQQPKKQDNSTAQPAEIVRLLKEPISIEGFQEKKKLKDVLEVFSDRTLGKVPIIVDRAAFNKELADPNFDAYEMEVSLPPVPKRMPMSKALQLILSQVGNDDMKAAYLVRRSYIEIVPEAYLTAKHRLTERVQMRFVDRPLDGVLADLAEETSLTITLDPGVGKKAATPISAIFRNSRVEDALVAVTEMAELKFVVLQDSVYVTTPAKAAAIQKEEKARAQRRRPPIPQLPVK